MNQRVPALLAALNNPDLKPIDLSLDRVVKLLAALGNPQDRLPPVIHVAGTNGKGSLVAYLHAIFEAAGLRVHRYISPHLVRFHERIVLAGREIDDDTLQGVLSRVQEAARNIPVTFFEATTAAAFLAFAEHQADVLLLEVGMGGRLDATNVIEKPMLTVITPVSIDHAEYLGDTLEKIAGEKAGILKRGVPCVVGPQQPAAMAVIEKTAAAMQVPLFQFGHEWNVQGAHYCSESFDLALRPSLAGSHQVFNAATAVACIQSIPHMGISSEAIAKGIASAKWPARLQLITNTRLLSLLPAGSELWLDGGHNPDAGVMLAAWAATQKDKPLVLVCGMIEGKDTAEFLKPLAAHVSRLYAVSIEGEPTGQPAAAIVQSAGKAGIAAEAAEGLKAALAAIGRAQQGGCRVLICGSLYLAGKVLSLLA